MKKTIVFSALFIMSLSLIACSSSQEKVESAEDEVSEANKELKRATDEYHKDMEVFRTETYKKIDENNRAIAELKVGLNFEKESTKTKKLELINDLEAKNNELRHRLDNYKDYGKTKWEVFKSEFSNDMDELGKSIKAFGQNNE